MGFTVTWDLIALGLAGLAGAALVTITAAVLAGAGLVLTVLVEVTLLEVTARLAWMGAHPTTAHKICQRNFCVRRNMICMMVFQ